ncbi:endonuclease V [Aureisphaera galaxeae]|uniref:endonuclease V n=1 Tax=Aureisphaera galaxeae TaxID=1538023 RepID=UPI002350F61B|nr:endonuclease V [Aureisphaera galaxeae]MDC8006030.1 endonuclease V [Aureisphaera galaxeae]
MILAIDVYYREDGTAKTVGVLFNWDDTEPLEIYEETFLQVAAYIPGQFYKRELPCILKLLDRVDLDSLEGILVDGHVFVDNDEKLGLGGHLWESLNKKIPVIGVAKKSFHNTEKVSIPIVRGKSKNPLFVSCVGMELDLTVQRVQNMKGIYRIPDILKTLDQWTRKK